MKVFTTLIVALFSIIMISTANAGEPLIPPKVNTILGKVKPEMSEPKLLAVVRESYPEASAQLGNWSGHSGYIDFKINKRYTLSFSAISKVTDQNDKKIHKDLNIYIYDWILKRRIDMSFHTWDSDKSTKQNASINPEKPTNSKQ